MRLLSAAVLWLGLCCTGVAFAADESIPPPLDGWQTWVLEGHEHVGCPYVDGEDSGSASGRVCVWPGTLDLRIDGNVARFSQRVRLYTRGWLPLPGDAESWPQDVTVDGARLPVLPHEGQPGIELAP